MWHVVYHEYDDLLNYSVIGVFENRKKHCLQFCSACCFEFCLICYFLL